MRHILNRLEAIEEERADLLRIKDLVGEIHKAEEIIRCQRQHIVDYQKEVDVLVRRWECTLTCERKLKNE